MIRIRHRGNFNHIEAFFRKAPNISYREILERYAKIGVDALASNTPKDTGETAASWGYEIVDNKDGYTVYWTNGNINKNVNIAMILQYGHGTRNGGYVKGIDYINPALRPIFDNMANDAWKEVTTI